MRELVKSKFNIFPEMLSEEYMRLKSDIEVNGFDRTMPITLYNGEILDGWNRYCVCKELNIEVVHVDFKGDDSEAINFVMRSNKRRNLTASQWATIATEATDIIQLIAQKVEEERRAKISEAKKPVQSSDKELLGKYLPNSSNDSEQEIFDKETLVKYLTNVSNDSEPVQSSDKELLVKYLTNSSNDSEQEIFDKETLGKYLPNVSNDSEPVQSSDNKKTAQKVADLFNTNRTYINEAKKIKANSQEIFDKVKSGELSIQDAKSLIKLDKPKQIQILSKINRGEAKSVNHAIALNREADKVTQYKADVKTKATIATEHFKTWLPKQEKCDLLITDPPYSTDIKDINGFAKEWLPLALDKVKDTGSAYICIGGYPEEIQAYMNVQLPTQMLIWSYDNACLIQPKNKYNLNYQVILYYRFANTPEINKPHTVKHQFACQTINAPDGRIGNRYHSWQKPDELADRFILNSSKEGDLILDPFSCTGTFILSANKLGRIGKGCDIDQEVVKIAIERGCINE